ncbi:hypothetical protein HMPREF0308_2081, partial [Corynebacterium striatum ATCC 6940]
MFRPRRFSYAAPTRRQHESSHRRTSPQSIRATHARRILLP